MTAIASVDECVAQAIAQLAPAVAARFAADPLSVLTDDIGLKVTAAEHLTDSRSDGGACDGVSFLRDGVILYAPTPGSRRMNFTLAHELGHWLVESAPDVFDWIADQNEAGRLLETVCDRIAQQLLLPDSVVRPVIGRGPVRAKTLLDLYASTQASRPVCAIALASHLPGLGAAVIVDRVTGVVTHASVRPDPERGWPRVFPWPGQSVGTRHPLLTLPAGTSFSRRVQWRTPWGTSADYYIDALSDGVRTYAIFSATDLWNVERFHAAEDREFDGRPRLSGRCCGKAFDVRGYPCPDCGQPYCPQCGDCRCQRQAKRQVMCDRCFQKKEPHLVVGGICRDCH